MILLLPLAVIGQVLPVFFLNENRTNLAPNNTYNTDNWAQIPRNGGTGIPRATRFLRIGQVSETDCFQIMTPYENSSGRSRHL